MNPDDARALLARLLRRVAPDVDLEGAADDAGLQDDYDLDSVDFLNLVTALAEETGIEVPERHYRRLATVGGFVAYVTAASAPD